MQTFDAAFNYILSVEGGETDDPDDAGGWTRFGISARFLADAGLDPHMHLNHGTARALYFEYFWEPGLCYEMGPAVGFLHFDGLVQHPKRDADVMLQRALGVKADGIVGPKTLARSRSIDPYEFWQSYIDERLNYYWKIKDQRNNAKFLKGWVRRLMLLTGGVYAYAVVGQSRSGGIVGR